MNAPTMGLPPVPKHAAAMARLYGMPPEDLAQEWALARLEHREDAVRVLENRVGRWRRWSARIADVDIEVAESLDLADQLDIEDDEMPAGDAFTQKALEKLAAHEPSLADLARRLIAGATREKACQDLRITERRLRQMIEKASSILRSHSTASQPDLFGGLGDAI